MGFPFPSISLGSGLNSSALSSSLHESIMLFIWFSVVIRWKLFNPVSPQLFHFLAEMFPLTLCLNVIVLYVLLHSHPACMSHTYNHGLTLWMQNEAFLSYENTVLAPRHERLYLVFKHGASPCGWRPKREQAIGAEFGGRCLAETSHGREKWAVISTNWDQASQTD